MADGDETLITSDLNGGTYAVVKFGDGEAKVYVVVSRKPVNGRGFYQSETVYRTIKPGSRNWKHAVAKAATEQLR